MPDLISLGVGGLLNGAHIVAAARAGSAPIKRLLQTTDPAHIINLTYGYPRRSVILLDNGCLAIVTLSLEELYALLNTEENP